MNLEAIQSIAAQFPQYSIAVTESKGHLLINCIGDRPLPLADALWKNRSDLGVHSWNLHISINSQSYTLNTIAR